MIHVLPLILYSNSPCFITTICTVPVQSVYHDNIYRVGLEAE